MHQEVFILGDKLIPFFVGTDCRDEIVAGILSLNPSSVFVLTDETVMRLHSQEFADGFPCTTTVHVLVVPPGEQCKTLDCLHKVVCTALQSGVDRRSIFVSLGGGAVGNLTGLAAALLFRGISFVHVPTTLLAMHDSVTSQKQAVNCHGVKNIVGTYHAPEAIYCDTRFLNTLTHRHVSSGLAELAKNALIFGGNQKQRFEKLLPDVFGTSTPPWVELVTLGLAYKSEQLKDDPLEKHEAIVFEYGHTVGHAIEIASFGTLNHGEAIVWGMRVAATVAQDLKFMDESALAEHEAVLRLLGAVPIPPASVDLAAVCKNTLNDNKRGICLHEKDTVSMVLLRKAGSVVRDSEGCLLMPVPLVCVEQALRLVLDRTH